MTRENKLALLVGFVVILVVGILLSDHFSIARHQKAANLLAVNDPLVESAAASAPLIGRSPLCARGCRKGRDAWTKALER